MPCAAVSSAFYGTGPSGSLWWYTQPSAPVFEPVSASCPASDAAVFQMPGATQAAFVIIDAGAVMPAGTTVHVDTCESSYDTLLVVGTGCPTDLR